MGLFNFDDPINRRGFGSVKWDSLEPGILPLFVADMDFRSSPQIIDALQKILDHGVFGYGYEQEFPGIIKKWFWETYNLAVEEDWIITLPAIVPVLAAVSHIRPGKVLINTPNYHVLLAAPLKAGKERVLSPMKNTDEYYEIDFEDLRRRTGPEVGLFYLSNPHNPVGRVYTRTELEEVKEFAQEKNLIVVSDEAHCGLVFDRPHIPFFSVSPSQSITLMGPGKTFNMAGLPFGFAVIPQESLRQDFAKISYSLPHPGICSLAAAKAAYGASQEWRLELVDYLRGNRDWFEKTLGETFPGIKLTHVEGTYLQWVDFRPLGIEEPYHWLKEQAKILTNDGGIFGAQGEGYVRFNFGTHRSRLEEAVNRIQARWT